MKRLRPDSLYRCLPAFVLAACLYPVTLPGEATKDYQLKAAYLYNFLKFVDWPRAAGGSSDAIDVCVLGRDPFYGELDVMSQRKAQGRDIRVFYLKGKVTRRCHLLFIVGPDNPELPQVLEGLAGHPVVTVSDIDAFARRGGMIGFVTRGNKVRLEINIDALRRAGIRVRASLLNIATIVKTAGVRP